MKTSTRQLYFEKALKLFLPHIPNASKVVDIDPKQGIYCREFARSGFEVTGIQPEEQPFIDNPFVKEMLHKRVEDVLLPYKSIGAVWAHQTLNGLPKDRCRRRLSLFYDWLAKNGVLYFGLLEGEGSKLVKEQNVTGIVSKLVIYYNPQEIEEMLSEIGYETVEAWREFQQDRNWIHVIARKNE